MKTKPRVFEVLGGLKKTIKEEYGETYDGTFNLGFNAGIDTCISAIKPMLLSHRQNEHFETFNGGCCFECDIVIEKLKALTVKE